MGHFGFSSSSESLQGHLEYATETAENTQYAPGFSQDAVRFLRMKSDEQPATFFDRLLAFFKENKEARERKFTQLAPEAQQFVVETLEQRDRDIHPQEFDALLLTLAVTPEPEVQKKLCKEVREILDRKRNQELRDEIIMRIKLELALDECAHDHYKISDKLLEYYKHATPEERALPESKQRIRTVLKDKLEHEWTNIGGANEFELETAEYIAMDIDLLHEVLQKPFQDASRLYYYMGLTREERESTPYKEEIQGVLHQVSKQKYYLGHGAVVTYLTKVSSEHTLTADEYDLLQQSIIFLNGIFYEIKKDPRTEEVRAPFFARALLSYYATLSASERDAAHNDIDAVLNFLYKKGEDKILDTYILALTPEERFHSDIQKRLRFREFDHSFTGIDSKRFFHFYNNLTEDEKTSPLYTRVLRQALKSKPTGKEDEEDIEKMGTVDLLLEKYAMLTRAEREQPKTRQVIRNMLLRSNSMFVMNFFNDLPPEEPMPSPLTMAISRRVRSALTHEVGDVELRKEYTNLVLNRIGDEAFSIIAMDKLENPRKRVCLATGLAMLGLDTTAALSWQLTEDQERSLRYAVSRLAAYKQNHQLLKGVTFPFRPRDEKVAGFERALVEWFRGLDFLNSLGDQLHARSFLTRHITKIKKIERRQGIQHAIRDIPFSLLREVAGELRDIKQKVMKNFCQLMNLENGSPEKVDAFINRWGGNTASVLTFAQRLHKGGLNDVQKVFSSYINAEVEGYWEKKRYDLDDALTREQLAPLIAGKDKAEQDGIIQTYHHGVWLVHKGKAGKEVKEDPSGPFIVAEELKHRLTDEYIAHHHFEEVFSVSELAALDQTDRGIFQKFVLSAMYPKEKIKLRTAKELKSHFAGKISEQYLDAAIRLRQFLVDFWRSQKPADELLHGLERIIAKLPEQMHKLAFIQNDLAENVGAMLRAASIQGTVAERKRIFISRTTDHPKVLLEIGKFPANSGSCQSYDYANLKLVKSLPGYMEDAHIQGIVTSELVNSEEPVEIINIDEGRRLVEARMTDGSVAYLSMSEPLDRAIMMIGVKDHEAVVTIQPHYAKPGAIDGFLAESLSNNTAGQLIHTLQEKHGLPIHIRIMGESGIQIAGSHNPAGHYNDMMHSQQGQDGKSYIQDEVLR